MGQTMNKNKQPEELLKMSFLLHFLLPLKAIQFSPLNELLVRVAETDFFPVVQTEKHNGNHTPPNLVNFVVGLATADIGPDVGWVHLDG